MSIFIIILRDITLSQEQEHVFFPRVDYYIFLGILTYFYTCVVGYLNFLFFILNMNSDALFYLYECMFCMSISLAEPLINQKLGVCQAPFERLNPEFACVSSVCVCERAGVHIHLCTLACAGYWCMQGHSVVPMYLCCTGFRMCQSWMIVRDFKVVESSSESDSVFRQAGSGLPDKPLKTLNPVNSQCKSVCCTVLILNLELSPYWVCLRQVKLESLHKEHYLCVCICLIVCTHRNLRLFSDRHIFLWIVFVHFKYVTEWHSDWG